MFTKLLIFFVTEQLRNTFIEPLNLMLSYPLLTSGSELAPFVPLIAVNYPN